MTVEPIRSKEQIRAMYHVLYQCDPKYGLLFKFGINTGLRISDILAVRVCDLYKANGEFREYLSLRERKTGKEKKLKINDTLRRLIGRYVRKMGLDGDSFLFLSKKGGHIGRVQAYRVLRAAAERCGIESFGTHSLRKTWGYWTYRISKFNIGLIMDTLNHSSPEITLRYIGVSQDLKDELYQKVQL